MGSGLEESKSWVEQILGNHQGRRNGISQVD